MYFKYKGLDQEGRRVKGTISAATLEEAKVRLKSSGIFYESIKEAKESSSILDQSFGKRQMSGVLMSQFSKELSSYLKSGMTLITAIRLMQNQHRGEKRFNAFLEEIKRMIEEGKNLYQALSSQSIYQLPDFFLQSLNVAGQSGKLGNVLETMGNFFSTQSKVKKQVLNALAYPMFIFIVAVGMTSFLIAFVVPKISSIFADMGQELPPITKFVLGASAFLTKYYLHILIIFILLIILFKIFYSRKGAFRYFVDYMLLKMPIIGDLIQNYELGRFSYILSLMLDSGVSYAQAVKLASSTFNNLALKRVFEKAATKVVEGNKLSVALYRTKGAKLKRNFLQALALGEESSEVSQVLFNLSKLYNEENEDRLKMLLSLLEPTMMLLIGAIVGTIVMAMLLPLFSMNLAASKSM